MRLIKRAIQRILKLFGYRFASLHDSVIDQDDVFMGIYNRCRSHTLTTKERMYALYKAVQYVIGAGIPGDFVECGVWAGGSSMVIAMTLVSLNVTDRELYLYDTFSGMTEQTKEDFHVENKDIKEYDPSCVPIDRVKKNMESTVYSTDHIIYVKGKVEDTIPGQIPKGIALLRLDTDWYESTRHELVHLFPLVSHGGVVIVDDYGAWAGSKKAVDEYFSQSPILLNRIDHDSRIGIKI